MAMSVTYATVHGRLVEENRGGVVTEYVPDTLGNVIMTTDESGTVTSTTTYWPFGEVRTQTGTNPSPWGFCGVWGYLTDAVSRMYVRARHYRADTARWLTVDPFWPDESAYGYADNAPIDNFDPEGTWVIPVACASACLVTAGCAAGVWIACGSLWGTSDFDDCAKDYIESLPPISKIGCGVGLLGCLACIVYYLRGKIPRPPVRPSPNDPRLPTPWSRCRSECLKEIALKEALCAVPRRCRGTDSCEVLHAKHAAQGACYVARRNVMRCYGQDISRRDHIGELKKAANGIRKCQKFLIRRRCFPWRQVN